MPRQLRQIEVGEIYHVINRGVEKRQIFLKPQDYSRFVIGLEFFNQVASTDLWKLLANWNDKTIDEIDALGGTVPPNVHTIPTVAERLIKQRNEKKARMDYLVEILAFALMPNHIHLILREIREGGTSAFMGKMGGYSTYFNKQYKRVGSLFQSRYKSIHVSSDYQLQTLFNYVHTNPVELNEPDWKDFKVKDKKKAIKDLEKYRWSSYRDYIGLPTHPFVTQREFFHDTIGDYKDCRETVEGWVYEKAELEGKEIDEIFGA